MKTTNLTAVLIIFCVTMANAQYNSKNLKLESDATSNVYEFKNLRLYPIRANKDFETQHRNLGTYTTLKEALEKKKIAITEAGTGQSDGSVNTLYIENISKDTIMILAGEVVQGGKQDRMIGQDFVLYPGSGKKDISVFCVEHGRWRDNGSGMAFHSYYTISNNEVRKAATVKKDQQEVWKKVAETTDKNKANSSSGTLTALKNSGDLSKELKAYQEYFKKVVASETDVIGVIAVSGDNILGCDMFATHALLAKHYSNLVGSYATEAITSGKQSTVSFEKVKQYLQKIIADESVQEKEVEKNGTMLKDKGRKLHISTF
jgi:hypothetical protein